MPTDSSGVFSLIGSYLAATGTPIVTSQHNPVLEDIAAALTGRLSRNGTAPMTAPLKLADGTVAAPSLTFSSDPSSGFYKTLAGFAVAIGGVKVAEFLSGGVKGARLIGELVPYTGTSPPPLFVHPFGQTLSRAAYPDLWTFAQAEIALGNLLYNNGDGSTTFGVPDLRGRVIACNDAMTHAAAGRLTSATMTPNGTTNGAVGGVETVTLAAGQLPANIPNTLSATFSPTSGTSAIYVGTAAPNTTVGGGAGASVPTPTTGITLGGTVSITGAINPSGGASHSNAQPSLVCTYLLFAGA